MSELTMESWQDAKPTSKESKATHIHALDTTKKVVRYTNIFVTFFKMKSWASIVSSPPPSPAGEVAQPKQVVAESKADGHLVAAASINPIKPAEVLPRPPRGPRKRVVVVDTNSIINNVPFSSFGEQFVTVSEVLEEVRDPEARRRLEQMMMLTKLETRVPSKEAVAKVVAFANGTGDIGILSGADIKLIALTRMIELELNGEEHLRSSPVAQAQVFSRPAEEEVEGGDDDQDGEDSFYDGCVVEELHEGEEHEHKVVEVSPNPAPLSRAPVAKAKSPKVASSAPISLPGWGGDWVSDSVQLQEAKQGETVPDGKEIEEEEGSTVACLTADFAMQNVLIQMGLRVLSPDGKRITRVKQWALRCFACFKITRNMEKQFCPQVLKWTVICFCVCVL
jgi:RNA-binding protein NOB1